jgi:predicted nucleic acid-binding protein
MLDASVLLAAEDADDAHHIDARRLLQSGQALATLDLAAYEVTNVAETRWHDPAASERLRERVWLIARYGLLVRVDRALLDAATQIARTHELSAYDAAYVAAARHIGWPLASCDERDLVRPGLALPPRDL